MTPSPALVLLTFDLLHAIRVAASPETPTALARLAKLDAVTFARQAFREVAALEHRADMRRLMAQVATRPYPRTAYQRDGCWYYLEAGR